MSAASVTLSHVSTKDQTLSAELHGEALLTARRPELQPLIDHLRDVAQGRDDIRTECAEPSPAHGFQPRPARRRTHPDRDATHAGRFMRDRSGTPDNARRSPRSRTA